MIALTGNPKNPTVVQLAYLGFKNPVAIGGFEIRISIRTYMQQKAKTWIRIWPDVQSRAMQCLPSTSSQHPPTVRGIGTSRTKAMKKSKSCILARQTSERFFLYLADWLAVTVALSSALVHSLPLRIRYSPVSESLLEELGAVKCQLTAQVWHQPACLGTRLSLHPCMHISGWLVWRLVSGPDCV